jgi:hypothetical protein
VKTSRIEAETVVLWNDAEPDAIINTRSATTMRRMSKKGYVFKELPPKSGLFRATVPKRLCLPRAVVKKIQPKTPSNTRLTRVGRPFQKRAKP